VIFTVDKRLFRFLNVRIYDTVTVFNAHVIANEKFRSKPPECVVKLCNKNVRQMNRELSADKN
jgi:hypothetical protein